MEDYPALDPDTICVTRHAVARYMERRGWPAADGVSRLMADDAIRDLLWRHCTTKNPPITFRPGHKASRPTIRPC